MKELDPLLASNKQWAADIKAQDPTFFEKLSAQQTPEYLWIGCADSRVPANEIVDLLPGELFVHRNIANCVVHTDLNCLSVIYYAVRVLKVKHIIVCGHYGCGGVQAALTDQQFGLADHWIRNIRDVYSHHFTDLENISDKEHKVDRLCELNVIQQMLNVAHLPVIQNAWADGQDISVNGWIYSIKDGLLKKLSKPIFHAEQIAPEYRVKTG